MPSFEEAFPSLSGLSKYRQLQPPSKVESRDHIRPSSMVPADKPGRRQLLATIAPWFLLSYKKSTSFAAENAKGFLPVTDKKDGYSFVYPFGWQDIVIEGQDKVFKDVIEPLENVSVPYEQTGHLRPWFPKRASIKKVLAPPSQTKKLLDTAEHDVDGEAYYTFEFVAQAPNFTRHALSTICIGNVMNHIYSLLNAFTWYMHVGHWDVPKYVTLTSSVLKDQI